jgi:hypothetical protein
MIVNNAINKTWAAQTVQIEVLDAAVWHEVGWK